MNRPHVEQTTPALSRAETALLFDEVLVDIFPDRTALGRAPFNVACHLKAFGLNPALIPPTPTSRE